MTSIRISMKTSDTKLISIAKLSFDNYKNNKLGGIPKDAQNDIYFIITILP